MLKIVGSSRVRQYAVPFSVNMRTPLIKFIGARLPRPNFAAVSAQPFPCGGPSPASASSAPPSTTGLKKKSGPLIEESQLPLRFRRPLIDDFECMSINNGGSYGLQIEEPKKAGKK